jgi:hypothetical protein
MPTKKYKRKEQIATLLRQVEAGTASDTTSARLPGRGNHRADVFPLAQGILPIESGPGRPGTWGRQSKVIITKRRATKRASKINRAKCTKSRDCSQTMFD